MEQTKSLQRALQQLMGGPMLLRISRNNNLLNSQWLLRRDKLEASSQRLRLLNPQRQLLRRVRDLTQRRRQ
jgi:hypothetical protein